MIGILNEQQIEQVISNQVIGRIGCHTAKQVYVVPVSYAYHDGYVYVRSFEGKKMEIMRKNPNVCFQVDVMKDMANWESVVGFGDFEELKEVQQRKNGLEILMQRKLPVLSSELTHLGNVWPFESEDSNAIEGVIFRIKLKDKTGRFERSELLQHAYVL